MKRILLFCGIISAQLISAQVAVKDWAFNLGSMEYENIRRAVFTSNEDMVICGTVPYMGGFDLDPGSGTVGVSGNAQLTSYIARYNSSGDIAWGFAIDGEVRAIALDGNENVYAFGNYEGTVDFDPSASTNNLTTTDKALFIVKYDMSGNFDWAKSIGDFDGSIGSASGTWMYPNDIYVENNVINVNGELRGTQDIDPSGSTTNLTSTSTAVDGSDPFIAQYDSNGDLNWAFNIGGTGVGIFSRLLLDSQGNSYLYGQYSGDLDFNPSGGNVLTSAVTTMYLAKYDINGDYVWAGKFDGTTGFGYHTGLSFSETGEELLACFTYGDGTFDVDPGAGTANVIESNSGSYSSAIVKIDTAGVYDSHVVVAGIEVDGGESAVEILDVASNGEILAVVYFTKDCNYLGNSVATTSAKKYIVTISNSFSKEWDYEINEVSYNSGLYNGTSMYLLGSVGQGAMSTVNIAYDGSTDELTSNGFTDILMSKYTFVDNSGIKEVETDYKAHPNPTSGLVTVSFNQSQTFNFQLLSLDGKVIASQNNISDKQLEIDLSNQADGIYWLKIETQNELKTLKLVKQ